MSKVSNHKYWVTNCEFVNLEVKSSKLEENKVVAQVPRSIYPLQDELKSLVTKDYEIKDFGQFLCQILGWQPFDLMTEVPEEKRGEVGSPLLEIDSVESFAVSNLRPDYFILLDRKPIHRLADPEGSIIPGSKYPVLMLIDVHKSDIDLINSEGGISPVEKMSKLMINSGVCAGLITNHKEIIFMILHKDGTTGYVVFSVRKMCLSISIGILSGFESLFNSVTMYLLPHNCQKNMNHFHSVLDEAFSPSKKGKKE